MKYITKYILVLFGILNLNYFGLAQTPAITQLFSTPNYLSPAFAGIYQKNDINILYRNQWPNSPINYEFNSININLPIEIYQSGLNLNLFSDRQANFIETINLGGQYSYQLNLNKFTKLSSGIGINARYLNFNTNSLLSPSQITNIANNTGIFVSDPISLQSQTIKYVNLSIGVLLLNPNFWFGISAQNLGNPNLKISNNNSNLNKKQYSLQTGIKKTLNINTNLTPFINYFYWGNNHRYQIGSYLETNPLVFGTWLNNTDFITSFIGYKSENYSIGYSYDLNLNSIKGYAGGHEIMLTIRFKSKNLIINTDKIQNKRAIACPQF
ncbi:MAG: hypothetical protein RIR51_573 [Bacteroidota bacterium]|jgi:type IX secretion system PorP/SprF family membrane protein